MAPTTAQESATETFLVTRTDPSTLFATVLVTAAATAPGAVAAMFPKTVAVTASKIGLNTVRAMGPDSESVGVSDHAPLGGALCKRLGTPRNATALRPRSDPV